jgi:elongation factor G
MSAAFLIEVAIEPQNLVGRDALIAALAELTGEDCPLGFALGQCGEIILRGVSGGQIDAAVHRLKNERQLDLPIGPPQVAYREKLTKRVEID